MVKRFFASLRMPVKHDPVTKSLNVSFKVLIPSLHKMPEICSDGGHLAPKCPILRTIGTLNC